MNQRKRGKTAPTSSPNVDTAHANTLRPKKRKERSPAHLKPLARTHSTPDGIVPDRVRNGEEDTAHLEVKVDKVCAVVIYGVAAVLMYSNLYLIFKFSTSRIWMRRILKALNLLEFFSLLCGKDLIRCKTQIVFVLNRRLPATPTPHCTVSKRPILLQRIADFLHPIHQRGT